MKILFSKSFVSALLIILFLVGCGQNSDKQGSDASKKMDEIEITVTQYPGGLASVPYQVGMDKGFFEEEGIKIKGVVPGAGGGTTVRNILAGKLPFGEVATSAVIQSFVNGANVQIIASGPQTLADFVYVSKKDSSFAKIQDLVGHKMSFTNPGSTSQATAYLAFDKAGVDAKSIELVSSGGINEGLTLLKDGALDAAFMLEPAYSQQQQNWKLVFRLSDYVSEFQQNVIVASPQVIKENPDLVKRFLNAYRKSVNWIYENPAEAGKINAKYADIDEKISANLVEQMTKVKHWNGDSLTLEGLKNAVKAMEYAGTLKEGTKIEWSELINQEFIAEDKKIDITKLNQ